jgi:hypothetical protein
MPSYDTNLLKATGLVQETLTLLDAYQLGQSKEEFTRQVIASDLLGKATQSRVNDIISRNFYRRYVSAGPEVLMALKRLQNNYVAFEVLNQLFLIYTCRTNEILADFIKLIYWPKATAGSSIILNEDAMGFIHEAISDRHIISQWSESSQKFVAAKIMACLIDFRLIEKNKAIRQFSPADATINFLLHEGHFKGLSDMQLLRIPDWAVLGLSTNDLVRRINQLAQRGHFIAQYSGELLTISWFYQSLEAAADGISRA